MIVEMSRVEIIGLKKHLERLIPFLHTSGYLQIDDIREIPDVMLQPFTPTAKMKEEPTFKGVVDLSQTAPSTPAGAIRADQIVVKDKALQFSKQKSRKKPSLFFDDLGQKNFLYQLLMFLVVIFASLAFLLTGLYLGGVIGG